MGNYCINRHQLNHYYLYNFMTNNTKSLNKRCKDSDCPVQIYTYNISCDVHVCAQSLSHTWFFVIPWTVACQASLSMEFSRQEYWRGCHLFLQGSSWIMEQTCVSFVSCIGRKILYHHATLEAPYYSIWLKSLKYLLSSSSKFPHSTKILDSSLGFCILEVQQICPRLYVNLW